MSYQAVLDAILKVKTLRSELAEKVSEGERLTNERNKPAFEALTAEHGEAACMAVAHIIKSNSLFIQCVTALASCDDQKTNGELGHSFAKEFYENLRAQAINALEAHGLTPKECSTVMRTAGKLMNHEADVIADISAKQMELKDAVHSLPKGSQLIAELLAGLDDDEADIKVVELKGGELIGLLGEIMQAMAKKDRDADGKQTHKAPDTKQ